MANRQGAHMNLPRPCEVTSHNYHVRGICWAINAQGHALVEVEGGEVRVYELFGKGYTLRFIL
jgi:hypothetical protein